MAVHHCAAVAFALLAVRSSAGAASQDDLRRARTKRPRDEYRGGDQAHMSRVLNGHLLRAEPDTRSCAEWSPRQLQEFMAEVASHRDEALQAIYRDSADRRLMAHEGPEDRRGRWERLNEVAERRPYLLAPLQEALCREAVMWWTHHVTHEKRR